MTASRRIHHQPAWLLHHRPFRDTSRILDVLSRDHGRLSLVARGSRAAKSKLRGILRPFLPLQLSWVIRSDLGTLTGAEMDGAPIALAGDALLGGYYLNELLLKLLHRHDPQPEVFAAYTQTIERLAGQSEIALPLRLFEIELLRILGYALNLDHDTATNTAIRPGERYEYRPERGPVSVGLREGGAVFSGEELIAIREQDFSQPGILEKAGRLTRQVLNHHLDGKELLSRKVMRDLRRSITATDRDNVEHS